jgi:TusA-related sulfurtransferase
VSHSSGQDGDYEKLSKAITEAVLSSPKVKKIVSEIQKRDEICPQSFMVLVLKLQSLTEGFEVEVEEAPEKSKKKVRRTKKKMAEEAQYIDGARLSKKEIEFEEFINERFDAEEWLKRNGLIL